MSNREDRIFCHACGGVALQVDETDLSCPLCESDFTEIIEIPPDNDPPEQFPAPESPRHESTDDDRPGWRRTEHRTYSRSSMPGSPSFTTHSYSSPNHRFTFISTSVTGGFPTRQGNAQPAPTVPTMLQGLDAIFRSLGETGYTENGARRAAIDPFHSDSSGWEDPFHRGLGDHPDPEEIAPRDPALPRYADPALPRYASRTAFPSEGSLAEYVLHKPRYRNHFGRANVAYPRLFESLRPATARRTGTGPNPLAMLSALLDLNRNGDAVYSQEELDRVISQLIDHNATGTAPPPAPTSAIHSLPRKKADQQMLGSDGKAECSICKDTVELGTEVAMLPCKHWFHFDCIEMWLTQQNTCPHCRRSINPTQADPAQDPARG
ncbi:RING finger domain protein [Penicillium malachiteum]|uniref:RING finger domain protein n=1 Tax=Penicillium malachiteum TaxID=1324776 RepID=UPI0025497E77|nr:RING finger domain protein [Penicillium malachiteum]KAJ5720527.1 RING finger domain protein [Penicillium malachiteum]